jgi:DNA-binding FadR family transcriptional regulator
MTDPRSIRKGGNGHAAESPRIAPSGLTDDLPLSMPTRLGGSSVHSAIANEIGLRIVRGDYPPGSVLPNEAKWAVMFNVSRSAVREAIKMLMAKSLLSSRPKVGSRVEPRERWNLLDRDVLAWYASSPDREKFLKTVQEFRYIVEPEAAALAAQRHTREQMDEISRACHEMGAATTLRARTEADTRFHMAILSAAGNELLVPLGVLIESGLDYLFVFITRNTNDLDYAQDLHEDIARQIRLRRPDKARAAVRKLLGNTDQIIAGGNGARPSRRRS